MPANRLNGSNPRIDIKLRRLDNGATIVEIRENGQLACTLLQVSRSIVFTDAMTGGAAVSDAVRQAIGWCVLKGGGLHHE